jgi:peptidoglycan/LPS O-acetylase OafA/YrhL
VKTEYRADIDGLRAIAVLSVFMYHLGLASFSGGYVGVDIFFVISGFLITRIITRDIKRGQFSLPAFYAKRFKRILPALAAMAVACMVVAYALLAPENLAELGDSAVAMALFGSNIFFYLQAGYFDAPAEMKPLLHTWSLAVEEQYYLLFPLMMMGLAKWNRSRYTRWLLILCLISFVVGLVQSYSGNQSAAFYWITSRAWELFLGSLLVVPLFPLPTTKALRELLSLLGLTLIAVSVFGFDNQTVFPGVAALVPTIGAALIIYAGLGGSSIVGRLLSVKPLMLLGLISYSLYLWHWPIIVYAKYYSITPLEYKQMAGIVVVALIVSWLSWRYVETPFRKSQQNQSKVLVVSLTVLAALMVGGLVLSMNKGFEGRYQNVTAHNSDQQWLHWTACQNVSTRIRQGQPLCVMGSQNAKPTFLLWGDSHAKSIAVAFDTAAQENDIKGQIAIQTGCPPLLGIERTGRTRCHQFNQTVLTYLINNPDIKTIVLAARWALSTKGTRYKQEAGKQVTLIAIDDGGNKQVVKKSQNNVGLFNKGLRRTVKQLTQLGRQVVIVGPIPEVGYHVPAAEFVASRTQQDVNKLIAPSKQEFKKRTQEVDVVFSQLSTHNHVSIIEPAKKLCEYEVCNVFFNGKVLYRDDDHLSTDGARYITPLISEYFYQQHKGLQ